MFEILFLIRKKNYERFDQIEVKKKQTERALGLIMG